MVIDVVDMYGVLAEIKARAGRADFGRNAEVESWLLHCVFANENKNTHPAMLVLIY